MRAASDDDAFIAGIRLANLSRLVELFRTQAAFCRASGSSPAHVSQLFQNKSSTGYRPVGATLARKMEAGLQLPRYCLDQPGGVDEHLAELAQRHELGLPPAQTPGDDSRTASVAAPAGLSALQIAVLDTLGHAMRAGRVSQADCVALLGKYIDTASSA